MTPPSMIETPFADVMSHAITEAGRAGVTPGVLADDLHVEPATVYAYADRRKTGNTARKVAILIAVLAKAGATGPLRWIAERAGYRIVKVNALNRIDPAVLFPMAVMRITAATGNVARETEQAMADGELTADELRGLHAAVGKLIEEAEQAEGTCGCEACADEMEGRR